ncbi:MAG: hypothetical protein QXS91_00120 [Candidatus Anstonellales archaeon]
MEESAETIKVSFKRLELIKKEKEELEKKLNIIIEFSDNVIHIKGNAENVFFAMPVIKAIAKGFSKEQAYKLLSNENAFESIDLRDFCNTENCIKRLKGRVIGKMGRIKKEIESSADCLIAVYGHSISIIAPYYTMTYAKEAIMKILNGSKHSSVLNYLSKIREQIMYSKLTGKDTF